MEVFKSPSTDAQARGAAIVAILDGVPDAFERRASGILSAHGIDSVSVDEWYPLQAYLDAYRTIVEEIGEVTLAQIGRTTPQTAEWPPGVDTPFDALASINDAYQMNHRGDDVGFYETTRTGATSARVTAHTPYPCTYERALVEGAADLFADGPARAETVESSGADCTFDVTW